MAVRVVRFTDVTPERIAAIVARIEESDGPPEGIPATGLQILHDEAQGTAVVIQTFATEEDMQTGDAAFRAMDAGDTPGTRASIDMCAVAVEMQA